MELLTQKFIITDSKGEDINVNRKNIEIYVNGKKTAYSLRDLFKNTEFDDGEIYGNSLLSYYTITDDGKLSVEGSTVELREETGEQIKVVKIKRPGITDDEEISFEEVQKFANDFFIEKPEEVFPDLNDEEKQVFAAEREKREATTKQEKAKADQALVEAETERLAKEKEEAETKADNELRESLDPKTVYNDKGYLEVANYYKGKMDEYTSLPPYRLWFKKDSDEEPCLFIERGNWKEQPEQSALEDETRKELTIEFTDLGTERELVFNTETKEMKLKQ